MAENRGGFRPTAPQNNPANISATGGAGQSGKQPSRYISGMPYGQGQQLMQQQKSAPMSAGPATSSAPAPEATPFERRTPSGATLTDPLATPDRHITAGVDYGRGAGSEVLPSNISGETRPTDNLAVIKKYYPALLRASQLQDAPDSYKRFLTYLSGQISG
jgi:hypothetical protein